MKAGRSLLARGSLSNDYDNDLADLPDGDALDGDSSATLIVFTFVGLGIAAYGGYMLVRELLPLG